MAAPAQVDLRRAEVEEEAPGGLDVVEGEIGDALFLQPQVEEATLEREG